MRTILFAAVVASTAALGCSDNPYDPNAPAIDPNAPRVHIDSPARGTVAGDVKMVTVTGTATDDTGVTGVTVNDVPAALAADGTWTVQVPVVPGTNLLHAVATDAQNNTGKESRAVVAGPLQDLAQQVPNALTATLSAQTFDAIGRGVAGVIKTADLKALVTNPVIHAGDPTGPDCLYGQVHITDMSIGNNANTSVTLAPQTGGLWLDVELDQVMVGTHLQWAVACLDGSRDIAIGASHVSISGKLTVALTNGQFDIHLVSPNISISGFDLDLGGVPGEIVDLLHIDTALGPVLGWIAEKVAASYVNGALSGLNQTKTLTVLKSQVDLKLAPAKLDFSTDGAIVVLDTSLRAHGDSGKFVFVPNTVPAMDLSHGFQLAVADDAANQLFASLWSAKGLDDTIKLANGPYGDVGKLYDSVEIAAKVPPFVDASDAQKGLVLTIGDLMATFRNGASVATAVAINAQVDLKIGNNADGSLHFDVGQPTVYVDILDEGVDGANQLSNAEFEAITSFALSRIVAVGSGSLGAIPLPAAGGVAVQNLTIKSQAGYLVVAGEVQ